MGGASDSEGRLEVCFDQRWTTVNGFGWNETDTIVACRQLGHSTSGYYCLTLVLVVYSCKNHGGKFIQSLIIIHIWILHDGTTLVFQ